MYLSLIFAVTKHGSHFQRKKCTRSVIHPLLTLQTETLDEHRRLHTSSLIHKGINIMMKFLSTRQTRPRSVNIPLPIRVTKCQWKTGWSSNEHVGNLSPPPRSCTLDPSPLLRPIKAVVEHGRSLHLQPRHPPRWIEKVRLSHLFAWQKGKQW